MNAQANYYNKLWSLQNFKSVIYAFCKGFADSLKFSDIFFLDSMDQTRQVEKLMEKDQRKERLLHRGESPGPSSDNLAKKRALEKRSKSRIVKQGIGYQRNQNNGKNNQVLCTQWMFFLVFHSGF